MPRDQKLFDQEIQKIRDDLGDEFPISPAELDAIEAFLIPILRAIMEGEETGQLRSILRPNGSEAPQTSAPL